MISLASLTEAFWNVQSPKKGIGFDNFIPKNGKKTGDASNGENESSNQNDKTSQPNKEDSTEGSKKKADPFTSGPFQARQERQHGKEGGGGGGSGGPGSGWEPWISTVALLLLAYYFTGDSREEAHYSTPADPAAGGSADREISWHDFLRLLQQQDVVKVVVSDDRQSARVYLKPNAYGLQATSRSSRMHQSADQVAVEKDGFHDQDQDHLDGLHAGPNTAVGSPSQTRHIPFFYRMQLGSVSAFESKLDEAQRALGRDPASDVPVQYVADSSMSREMLGAVPGLLMAAALYGMMRFAAGGAGASAGGRGGMGGIFQIGKSTAKKINKEDVTVNFASVAGCDEAKKEIMEFVDFLKDSDRFTKLGAKIPKGALLCGPPGTGKTLLAKAVAGEAGVPFYSISGSDFIEMFVGVGPSRVRDLFSEARANAPCIVFIDEIDAVGRQRGRGGMGGNDERENTLNQLLVEMDGFETSTGVVVLAGTNRVDILDQALTRPGRFDRQITVDKPDLKGRREIFKVHLQGITLEDDVEDVAGRLAGLTPGFAGADIANICNEAAIVAARRAGETVIMNDFEKATDRIIGGLESNKIMSMEDRSIVAHHEAGHAVAGWFLEHADPLLKVTIIPRSSGALGFAQYLPKEVFLRTQDQIMDIVCMALAGRAAEEIFFGRVTTGASDDLRRVTDLVYSTIQLYGMNSRLGQLSFPKDPNAMWEDRPYSEKTAKAMDEEAKLTVDSAYERTLNLLREKKDDLEKVANMLLEKETITHDDILELIGPRPYAGDPAYDEFVKRVKKVKSEIPEEDVATDTGPLTPGLA
jgi:AFG3 family protein